MRKIPELRHALPMVRAGMAGALVLVTAACDPSYCSLVHGDVRTAQGTPAPDGTPVYVWILAGRTPQSLEGEAAVDTAYVRAGAYEEKVCEFMVRPSPLLVSTLGRDTVVRVRSSPYGAPRARVDLVGAP